MEYVTLNNGVVMPLLGYGTCRIPARITERCVADALGVGCRSIDTAQCYGNEREVGKACAASGIPREELFITTKLWGAVVTGIRCNPLMDRCVHSAWGLLTFCLFMSLRAMCMKSTGLWKPRIKKENCGP
ncbi:aldo/keto reductase [Desulfovibrio sp. ZJ200]|uniref:aldo/keto reductase n=1 Tax=Desulfovibrio sp. ZJ200 TaxID=2709792 RepID=UPI0013EB1527|nr:aldo/keto reductase [Desulfovibrio sp. ZJ200]